jgi:hypothetical protein
MVLQLLNVCVQFDVGLMKCFVKKMQLNLLLWLHLKICKQMLVGFSLTFQNYSPILLFIEYIRYADHYVNVQGGPSHMNYSNCELILDIAKRFPVQGLLNLFLSNKIIKKFNCSCLGWVGSCIRKSKITRIITSEWNHIYWYLELYFYRR